MLVLAASLSLLVGLSLGLLGGGGSILMLPMLVYVLHVGPREAIASSLFVVGATSAVASLAHARSGAVQWRVGGLFAAAAMIGAFAGGRVAHFVPAPVLLGGFAVMMLVTAIAMMRGRRAPEGEHRLSIVRVLGVAAVVGTLSGLLGAGGGFLVVPALALFGGLGMRHAIGTSLFVIALQSAAGFAGQLGAVHLDGMLLAVVTLAAIVGSLAGARASRKVPADSLRRGFAWLVLGMGVFVLARQFPSLGGLRNMIASSFAPVPALIGGVLVGLAASLYLLSHGKVAGISGIYCAVFEKGKERLDPFAFVLGLVAAGLVGKLVSPGAFDAPRLGIAAVIVAGLLVGYGTRLGNGCTSGHGVCGISRLSARSIVATGTFIGTGVLTVAVVRMLGGMS
jgi:uncharacterized membrane protein YfcA